MKRKPIDKQTIKNWKALMYDTTYPAISESTGLSVLTIGNAIRTGKATQMVIEKLTKYFNEFQLSA